MEHVARRAPQDTGVKGRLMSTSMIPAAQYLRVSTDHQQYSMENQSDIIRRYAASNGISIVQTYADAGKSGLVLKQRDGLRGLIKDVVSGCAKYKLILVYDVGRWGRFQDADEAAHYEFICKTAGVPIHYCAECFRNDTETASLILKWLKRMMAGEYSRELSAKVFAGLVKVAQRGFRTGGVSGYAFRRMLVSPDRVLKQELLFRQRKSVQEDRVILVPGPVEETGCVREIFRLFTEEGRMPSQIANELNRQGMPYRGTSRVRWYAGAVNRLLRSPKYAGWHIYGMYSQRLQTPRVKVPESNWIRTPDAWEPIVSQETFDKAQAVFSNRTYHKTDEQLLDGLRQLLLKHGYVSEKLIQQTPGMPSLAAYGGRFGSLSEALALIGWNPPRLGHTKARRNTRELKTDLLSRILACCNGTSVVRVNGRYKERLRLSNRSILSIYICRYRPMGGRPRWFLEPKRKEARGVSLIARLNRDNNGFLDYHIMRNLNGFAAKTLLPNDDWLRTGTRLQSLADLPEIVQRLRLQT